MWKYMVHPERPEMTNKIRQHELCMPITKAIDRYSAHVKLIIDLY